MKLKIQQSGNGAAILLPSRLLKQMKIAVGDRLKVVSITPEGLTLKPIKERPHYKLADLMSQCDLTAPEPAEMAAWSNMQPVGREAL
jgi:antitoxin ChpS